MKIGYSFWGFLGPGITDTPDGGRSHRRILLDSIAAAGHDIVLLQRDRDREEAGSSLDLGPRYAYSEDLPALDLLWLEWRWPIPGRNTPADRDLPGYTPDLKRQVELFAHYTEADRLPTIVWDKDMWLDEDDQLRARSNVVVAEAAMFPRAGARSLLFPVGDTALDAAQRSPPSAFGSGTFDLVYIGNQYDRDAAFDLYFAPAAASLRHRVFGKWSRVENWPHVNFGGRIAFSRVADTYADALATVLLLPGRYATAGQMTQRIFEAALAGCLPLLPAGVRGGERLVPAQLHVASSTDVVRLCRRMRDRSERTFLDTSVRDCLSRLDLFRMSRQMVTVEKIFEELLGA
jgi:hypothetical protein